jgi:hypothetical protein
MRELADLVSACPGINKSGALRATGRPTQGLGSWRLMERCVGTVLIEDRANPWATRNEHLLFRDDRARTIFNLRAELLHGRPTPDRAAELVDEIEQLRAGQVQSWVEA